MKTKISGVFEVCIGAREHLPLLNYFQKFGYRKGEVGSLNSKDAFRLYNVNSRLKSIRLLHQDSDHGLIRLMIWNQPLNQGLEFSRMNVIGNRWGATLTEDIYNIQNHAEEAISQKMPVYFVSPQRAEIYKLHTRPKPFQGNYKTVREMCLIQPMTRQIFFQRFGYTLPFYGKINPNSFFKASQVTHVGLVTIRNIEHIEFYGRILGLLKVRESADYDCDYENYSSRAIFSLKKHQKYGTTDYDEPTSSKNPSKAKSGRLKIIWFSPESRLINKQLYSRPGCLGNSLYTYRVNDLSDIYKCVCKSKATRVTEISQNEFGERSFSFIAPDGYFWTIIED